MKAAAPYAALAESRAAFRNGWWTGIAVGALIGAAVAYIAFKLA